MIPDELDFIAPSPQNPSISPGPMPMQQTAPPPSNYDANEQMHVHRTVGEYASIWHGGFPGEPSIFEELGIHNSDVKANLRTILNPKKVPRNIDNNFLIGILFFIAYAFLLLVLGKPRFGTVYMVAVIGCTVLYLAFHYMSVAIVESSEFTVSTLVTAVTYCLPPLVPILIFARILQLRIITTTILSIPFLGWASYCSARYLLPIVKVDTIELLLIPLYLFYAYLLLLPLL